MGAPSIVGRNPVNGFGHAPKYCISTKTDDSVNKPDSTQAGRAATTPPRTLPPGAVPTPIAFAGATNAGVWMLRPTPGRLGTLAATPPVPPPKPRGLSVEARGTAPLGDWRSSSASALQLPGSHGAAVGDHPSSSGLPGGVQFGQNLTAPAPQQRGHTGTPIIGGASTTSGGMTANADTVVQRPVLPTPPSRHAGKPVITPEEQAVQDASAAVCTADLARQVCEYRLDMVADVSRHPAISGGRNEGRLLQLCVAGGRLQIKTGAWSMLRRAFNRVFGAAERLDARDPSALHEWIDRPAIKEGAWICCTPEHIRAAYRAAVDSDQRASETYSNAVKALSDAKIALAKQAEAIAALDEVLASA